MPLMSEVKQTGKRGERIGTFLSWMLAVLACLWVAWCCAIGPLYWFGDGLSDFGWLNVLYLVVAFAIWFSIVVALVRFGRGRRVLPQYFARRHEKLCNEIAGTPTTVLGIMLRHLHDAAHSRPGRALHAVIVWTGRKLIRCTDCWWKLMLVFVIGWLWIPTTLLAAFGADIRSQIREFSWALNQWTGLKQPYIGFFSFVPMDIYPTAHYMWPDNPTYLTDQHNVVLTVFYGARSGGFALLHRLQRCGHRGARSLAMAVRRILLFGHRQPVLQPAVAQAWRRHVRLLASGTPRLLEYARLRAS